MPQQLYNTIKHLTRYKPIKLARFQEEGCKDTLPLSPDQEGPSLIYLQCQPSMLLGLSAIPPVASNAVMSF